MKRISDFKELVLHLSNRKKSTRLAIVWPADDCTREAVTLALREGFISPTFFGCRAQVEADPALLPYRNEITICDAPDPDAAAALAVAAVRAGEADVLMKGMLNTDNFLRAVLNKECGILPKGQVLTHVTAAQLPTYDKLLLFSDVAVIPYPNDTQRNAQIGYLANICRALGEPRPRIALIHCSEKVDERHFPFTTHYATLSVDSAAGRLGDLIVDGPMDVKTACSLAAMRKKGLESPIMGEADALIFPDIEAGNTFYKTLTLFAGASMAGIVCGASAPIVLPSRGDSALSKLYSIALASL